MRRVDYMAVAEQAMAQITKGAFLTVRAGEEVNTMTIGWALLGFCWGRPVAAVAVRDSRHTFGMIERAADFTITVPTSDLAKELAYCGSRSGRDVDKFRECGLATAAAQQVDSPIIAIAGIQFECRIVYKAPMDPANAHECLDAIYPAKDYHTHYYGEIVDCYVTE